MSIKQNQSPADQRVRSRQPAYDPEMYTSREWARINALDKQEQRQNRRLMMLLSLVVVIAVFMGYMVWYTLLRSHDYQLVLPYTQSALVPGASSSAAMAKGFSSDVAVPEAGNIDADSVFLSAQSAGLFDQTGKSTVYGKDLFTLRSEASLTKIMTALVALEHADLDQMVTVTDTALDIEYGSSVCEIRPGDILSMRQLLYGMMIASGNDAAMMIAEIVGGSVDNFVSMMNERAKSIGAMRTTFENPSGLTSANHKTCIYDLYLIFNEALKYDIFQDIISRKNYYAEYRDGEGNVKSVTWESTNHYFTGEAALPDDVIVYGGKTGTTDDAGACLCLLTKNLYGDPYVAIILHAQDKDLLYQDMNQLLGLMR